MPTPTQAETDPADLDEKLLLVTYGRGLDIVSRCADAWGAEIEDAGKTMWFTPAAETSETGVTGILTGQGKPAPRTPRPDAHPFRLLGVPLTSLDDFQRHYQELRREVRLLALAHEQDYPLAKTLSDLFGSMQRELREGLDIRPHPLRSRRHGRPDDPALRGERRDHGPVRGAARLRRRVLPPRADAVAGPHPAAAGVPDLVPHRVRPAGGRAASPQPWASEPAYRAQA